MQAIKNRIIKWLGGYTRQEYADVSHKLLAWQVNATAVLAGNMGVFIDEIAAALDMLPGGKGLN